MLIQFRFNNFRSFKNDTVLDLEAAPISDFDYRPYSIAKSKNSPKILTCAAIFGANASGKSNLLAAFEFMKILVENSCLVNFPLVFNNFERFNNSNNPYSPFLPEFHLKHVNSEFEVYFYLEDQKKIFNYGFRIEDKKIVEEWLNTLPRTSDNVKEIFYREYDHLELPGLNKTQQKLIKSSLKPETLILTLGNILGIPIIEKAFNWFKKIVFINSEALKVVSENIKSNSFLDDVIINNLREAKEFLASFDPSIVDLIIRDNNGKKELYSKHKNSNGDQALFLFDLESAGTIKMLSLFSYLKQTLQDGGILVIDELNSQLHSLLQRFIVLMFINKKTNPNHAQLIFSTHDISFLSNELFRRDEIWLVEKDLNGESKLYPLYNVIDEDNNRVRKDENYLRNYIKGEYGAIPHLEEFSFFKEESNV